MLSADIYMMLKKCQIGRLLLCDARDNKTWIYMDLGTRTIQYIQRIIVATILSSMLTYFYKNNKKDTQTF